MNEIKAYYYILLIIFLSVLYHKVCTQSIFLLQFLSSNLIQNIFEFCKMNNFLFVIWKYLPNISSSPSRKLLGMLSYIL